MVTINNAGFLPPSDRNAFKNELEPIPGVKDVSSSNGMVAGRFSTTMVKVKGSDNRQQVNFISVAYNFLDVLNIEIKEGRGFSTKFQADTMTNGIPGGPLDKTIGSIILNETAVKDLNIKEPVIGKQIEWSKDGDTTYYLNIVGITKDFHFASLRKPIKPRDGVSNSKRTRPVP